MNEKCNLEEKSSRLIKAITILVVSFVIGVAVWAYFSPIITYSIVYWIGFILMGLPICCAAEGLVGLGLNWNFAKNWSRFLRLIYGVIWVLICMAACMIVINVLSSMLV